MSDTNAQLRKALADQTHAFEEAAREHAAKYRQAQHEIRDLRAERTFSQRHGGRLFGVALFLFLAAIFVISLSSSQYKQARQACAPCERALVEQQAATKAALEQTCPLEFAIEEVVRRAAAEEATHGLP